jgi:hypothetical protein
LPQVLCSGKLPPSSCLLKNWDIELQAAKVEVSRLESENAQLRAKNAKLKETDQAVFFKGVGEQLAASLAATSISVASMRPLPEAMPLPSPLPLRCYQVSRAAIARITPPHAARIDPALLCAVIRSLLAGWHPASSVRYSEPPPNTV